MATEKKIEIEVVKGVEGHCIYINNYRVAGPKPWGGGQTVLSWRASLKDFETALEKVKE